MKPYDLVGVNGNIYSVISYVQGAMRVAGYSQKEIKDYQNTCLTGVYDDSIALSCDILAKVNEKLGLVSDEDVEDYDDEDDDSDVEDYGY